MLDNIIRYASNFINNEIGNIVSSIINNILWLAVIAVCSTAYSYFSRSYRKQIAKIVLSESSHANSVIDEKKPHKYFKTYVEPNFIPLQFNTDINKSEVSFIDIWKTIVNKQGSKVMFIYAEAGMGKTELCKYLAYKLMLNNRQRKVKITALEDSGIYYSKFKMYSSIDEILDVLNAISGKHIEYIILDGFDEFKALRNTKPDQLLNDLFLGLNGFGNNSLKRISFSKLIITSRLELFAEGEDKVKRNTIRTMQLEGWEIDEPIEIIKIKYFNKAMALRAYSLHKKQYSSKLFSMNVRKKRILFKNYLTECNIETEKTVFKNPFFIQFADDLLESKSITNSSEITNERAIDDIIKKCFYKEFQIINRIEHILPTDSSNSFKDFRQKFSLVLDSIAKIMLEKGEYKIYNTEMPVSYSDYKNTRILLTRNHEQLEFSHRIFLEYFIAHIMPLIDYKMKQNLLNGRLLDIDNNSIARFYAYFLDNNRFDLQQYSTFSLQESIVYAIYSSKTYSLKKINTIDLIKAQKVIVKTNPILTCRNITDVLPLAREISYDNYKLKDQDLLDYINDKDLNLSYLQLVNLDNIAFFEEPLYVDIRNNRLQDLKGLNSFTHLESLWISEGTIPYLCDINKVTIDVINVPIYNCTQLDKLPFNQNIHTFNIILKSDAQDNIPLFIMIRQKIQQGYPLILASKLTHSDIDTSISILEKGYTFGGTNDNCSKFSEIIDFLDNVFYLTQEASLYRFDDFSNYIKSKLSKYYYKRADEYKGLKEYESAIADFSKAIDFDPSQAETYFLRGKTYLSVNKRDEALIDYSKAIEIDPHKPKYYYERGLFYYYQEKHDSAYCDFDAAIPLIAITESCNGCSKCYHCRGLELYNFEKYEEALANLNKAIDINPTSSKSFHIRSRINKRLSRYKDALADLEEVVKLDPDNVDCKEEMEELYAKIN